MSDNEMDEISREFGQAARKAMNIVGPIVAANLARNGGKKLSWWQRRQQRRQLETQLAQQFQGEELSKLWYRKRLADYLDAARWVQAKQQMGELTDDQHIEHMTRLSAIRDHIAGTARTTPLSMVQQGQLVEALHAIDRDPAAAREWLTRDGVFVPVTDPARERHLTGVAVANAERFADRDTRRDQDFARHVEHRRAHDADLSELVAENRRLRDALAKHAPAHTDSATRQPDRDRDQAARTTAEPPAREPAGTPAPAVPAAGHAESPEEMEALWEGVAADFEDVQRYQANGGRGATKGASQAEQRARIDANLARGFGHPTAAGANPSPQPQRPDAADAVPGNTAETLREQHEHIEALAARVDALAGQLSTLTAERDREKARADQLANGFEAVKADRAELRKELDEVKGTADGLKNRNLRLAAEIRELREQPSGLSEQLAAVTAERDAARAQADDYRIERDQAVHKLHELTPPEQRLGSPERQAADLREQAQRRSGIERSR